MKTFRTQRLYLSELTLNDACFVIELLNEPSFITQIGDKAVRTHDDAIHYLQTGPMRQYREWGFGLYKVSLKSSKEPIGMCGLLKRDSLPFPDLGFAFKDKFQGKGYGYESSIAVLEQMKTSPLFPTVLAMTAQANESSKGLLRKLGFEQTTITSPLHPDCLFFELVLSQQTTFIDGN